mmetsp:Transcript_23020/g.42393  ORF Transcript_23020/g.42393 Transcript_23020/m.42393 type:complete len:372 (+) Transcript_23020:52-1167(+)
MPGRSTSAVASLRLASCGTVTWLLIKCFLSATAFVGASGPAGETSAMPSLLSRVGGPSAVSKLFTPMRRMPPLTSKPIQLSSRGLCAAAGGAKCKLPDGGSIAVVSREDLFVSEPDPRLFGNEENPKPGSDAATGWTNENWLKSMFHFEFAEYMNGPSNFGVLRVMNDDLVQPVRGFGTHPHRDMEILTFVVDGALTHQDSLDSRETLGRGSIQYMTAGSGVRHSEHNWQERPLRFIQSWIVPRRRGLPPNYGSMVGDEVATEARRDKWAHYVSDVKGSTKTPIQINQDCNVFATELSPDTAAPVLELQPGRQAYMLCVEGEVFIGADRPLRAHDAAELKGPLSLEAVAGKSGALVLLFEMALSPHQRSHL